jgi:glutamate-1-semialdehyde 2,1-aminomutase
MIARAPDTGTLDYGSIAARAAGVLPGGVLGRHTYPTGIEHVPVSGKGAWIIDHSGQRFCDYSCGGGSLILGYSHPAIVKAVQEQAAIAMQWISILNMQALQLAEMIKRCVPWIDEVRLALSGAESDMFAMRLARAFTGRNKILKFDGAYHGNCDYALWNVRKDDTGTAAESAGIPRVIHDLVLVTPFNDVDAVKAKVREEWRDIAAIIVEPVQRYYAAERPFLEELRSLCDEHGIVLIFDEVVTGFRHALGGAAEAMGVRPDLSVFGKALGGGVPVSAVVGRRDVMEHANPRRGGPEQGYCYVTSSQAGNPLGAAAGIATLTELARPGVMPSMHASAEALKEGLRAVVRAKGGNAQVVGAGPLWDIVFADGPVRDHRTAERADKRKHLALHQGLIANGVMVRVGGRSYFSTAHAAGEIEHTIKAAEAALAGL